MRRYNELRGGVPMNILAAYYSRTGHTAALAEEIVSRLRSRGHAVSVERIEVLVRQSKWMVLARQVYTYPLIALSLVSRGFRGWWIARQPRLEDGLGPLSFPDASIFDMVCVGGPKWAAVSYPVARYLRQLAGLEHKPVAAFGTFGGPPFEVFELEFLFRPLRDMVEERGASLAACLGLSSGYHELYVLPLMELACRVKFNRPLRSFHYESEYGRELIGEFVDAIEQAGARAAATRPEGRE